MLTRRHLISLSAAQAFALNLFIREGRAQTLKANFPNKPVRIIVPVAAGGPTDIVARMLADKLSKMWDQQVFIENKGGAWPAGLPLGPYDRPYRGDSQRCSLV